MRSHLSKSVFFISALLPLNPLFAYEKVDTYQLSLEELLNVNVVSASRKEEKQHLAPGIITVVSAQEIKQFGARHLRDVIDRLVGIQVLGSHQDFHSKTSLRAVNSSHHEDTVLILLNGRPVRQATDGGLNSDLYIGFPVKSIKQIEVIRGPGSVIYGTNATSGVINIITRDAKDSVNATQADISLGSFGTLQTQVSSLIGDKNYSLNIEFNHFSSDGDPVEDIFDSGEPNALPVPVPPALGTYETGVFSNNIVMNGRYKNLTVNAIVMENHQESANSAFQLPSNPIDLERQYIDIGYLHNFSDSWDISFNYTHAEDKAQWQINEAAGDNFSEGRSQTLETIMRGKIGEDMNLLFGASHTANESGFDRGLPQGSKNSNNSVYTQVDYMSSASQKWIAGLQWNDPDSISADLSPRLGLIQGIGETNRWWFKFLYSEAYRSPNLVETDIDAPQLKGVPTLDPENIATYDTQLIYKTPTQYYALALYHSELENLIVRVPGAVTTHANLGFVKFKGIELETRVEMNASFSLTGNASYQENITDSGVENGTFSPQVKVKLGANYQNNKGLNLAIFNSYIGETEDLSEVNTAPKLNPEADAYNLLTFNASIDTGKMWALGKPGHSILSLYLDNILDEDVFAADLNFANANNTIPAHWGMGAYLTYSYKL